MYSIKIYDINCSSIEMGNGKMAGVFRGLQFGDNTSDCLVFFCRNNGTVHIHPQVNQPREHAEE